MDDVYDNLENYDDLNRIDELKNENKELKYKIEEYTSAIDKLQKDFDNLAAEHKKLEQNYSSLLKTAKAEIERKTHMIKELNIEKDKLVINARQNQHKNRFNKFNRETNKSKSERKSDSTNLHGKSKQVEVTKQIPQKDSKNDIQLPSADSLPPCNDDVAIEAGNCLRNRNNDSEDRSCTSKENDTQLLNKLSNRHTETVLKKITNRRKSMPVLSHEIKFSSDEECENGATREENRSRYKSRDETLKHLSDRNSYNNKAFEISSTEKKFPHYQESLLRNYSNNKSHLYYNDDKYKNRDQYLPSQRQRENYSPDRYRVGREYKDDYYQRYDYNNQWDLESPPREKSYHHSRSRDRRSNYSRDYSRDFFRSRNDKDRYAEKYKHQIDVEEPSCKRQKIDYGYRHIHEDRWQKDIEFSKAPLSTPLEHTEHFSCQSPDFVHSDYFTYAPTREIRGTAIVHLEDPRISSRKYKIINDNDKNVLSTVTGRNVNFIPVDKKLWGFEPVPMPKALLEPPSDDVINFKKHTYSATDKTTSNTSVDSGEILDYNSERNQLHSCETSDSSKNNDHCVMEPYIKEIREIETETIRQSNDYNHSKQLNSQTNKDSTATNICDKALGIDEYKNTKIQKNTEISTSKIKINDTNEKSYNDVKTSDTDNIMDNSKTSSDDISMPQLTTYTKLSESENKYNDIATSTKIVEADLVLSDDLSDDEPLQQTRKKQTKAKCKKNKIKEYAEKKSNKFEPRKSINSKVRYESVKITENNEKQSYVDEDKIKTTEKLPEHVKRTRKKAECSQTNDINTPKVTKIKKTKKDRDNKTQEIKAKFGDLFGDSSSLITPDDLGIVLEVPKAKDTFVTIFENTQDAVDLNFKEMEKVLTDINNSPQDTCVTIKETKCNDHKPKNDLTVKEKSRCNETKSDCNTYENLSKDTADTVKTIIISTGRQPQFDMKGDTEHLHLQDAASAGKVLKPFENLKALATSTPAKPIQHEQNDSLAPDCSNTNSTNNRVNDLSYKVDNFPNTDLKDPDVPDVRIFVKRRRKTKKVTS